MKHGVLLVDSQRETVRQLRAALRERRDVSAEILEAASGEEALLVALRSHLALLVVACRLPGMDGLELVRKIRAGHPDVSVIMLAGKADREMRPQLLNAGALYIFEKPVSIPDFLVAVERALGAPGTIFPSEHGGEIDGRHARIADLLANFRQDNGAQAAYLLDLHGRPLVRAGDLPGLMNEPVLQSALAGMHSSALAVSGLTQQSLLDVKVSILGKNLDLLFAPVASRYALLVAGRAPGSGDREPDWHGAVNALCVEILRSLASMGVGSSPAGPGSLEAPAADLVQNDADSSGDLHRLLERTRGDADKEQLESYWQDAAERLGNRPVNPEVLTFEQAKRMGLAPERSAE